MIFLNKQKNESKINVENIAKAYSGNIFSIERPISEAYLAIDSDLARDNLENHLSAADLQDL